MEYNKIFYSGSFASISFSISYQSSPSEFCPFVQHQDPKQLFCTWHLQIVIQSKWNRRESELARFFILFCFAFLLNKTIPPKQFCVIFEKNILVTSGVYV